MIEAFLPSLLTRFLHRTTVIVTGSGALTLAVSSSFAIWWIFSLKVGFYYRNTTVLMSAAILTFFGFLCHYDNWRLDSEPLSNLAPSLVSRNAPLSRSNDCSTDSTRLGILNDACT